MPENPWELTLYLSVCWPLHLRGGQPHFDVPLWDTVSKTICRNQLALKHLQDSLTIIPPLLSGLGSVVLWFLREWAVSTMTYHRIVE